MAARIARRRLRGLCREEPLARRGPRGEEPFVQHAEEPRTAWRKVARMGRRRDGRMARTDATTGHADGVDRMNRDGRAQLGRRADEGRG
jgi:hypothetical protein